MRRLPAAWALILIASSLPGCVAQGRTTGSETALEREREEHQATARALAAANEELGAAREEATATATALREREAQLEAAGRALSGAELAADVAARQRGEQSLLVDQLREELGRSAEHLLAYSTERTELRDSLADAQQRLTLLDAIASEAERRAALVRDATLWLHAPLATGEVELELADGVPVLRAPLARCFVSPGGALQPEIEPALAAIARVAATHSVRALNLTEIGGPGDRAQADVARRLDALKVALVRHGVPAEHIVVSVPLVAAEAELAQLVGTPPEPLAIELGFRL